MQAHRSRALRGSVAKGSLLTLVLACSPASQAPPSVQSGTGFNPTGSGGTSTDSGTTGNHAGAGTGESIPSSARGYTLLVGGTVPVGPGVQVGYALTATAPRTYQFRWTGDARVAGDGYQEFYGSLWTSGTFTSLTPGCVDDLCPLESGDYVSGIQTVSGGQRIDWDTFASTGWDGFSFTTDTEPVYFDVYIDGARHPELFYFAEAPTGTTTTPASSPFAISSEAVDGG